MVQTISAIFLLAVLVEGLIEYFVSDPNKSQPWLRYVSALFGIAVSLAYKVDLLASLDVMSAYPFVGEILTGLIIGRGSNYLNEFVGKVRSGSTKVEVPSNTTSSVSVETTA